MTIELNRNDATVLCAMIQDAHKELYNALGNKAMNEIMYAADIDSVKELLLQTLDIESERK